MYQSEEVTNTEDFANSENPKVSPNKYWFAFYTKPKHEFKSEQFIKSIDLVCYLPTITTLKQWSDRKKKVTEPLFKGYVFVNCTERERYYALQYESIISTVNFSGKPARIPDWQIENLKRMLDENREVFVTDMIAEGTKVKIIDGPFSGVTGIVAQSDDHGKVFGVTIDLLRRTVLVKLSKESIIKEIDQK
jgi:transcription antitermination factor NusG